MAKLTLPLPEKRVTFKKGPGDTKYAYYTIRAYRNSRGQPTSDEKSIGKLDNETGMLIPNRNYYELFPEHAPPTKLQSIGYTKAFYAIAKKIGLIKTLEKAFSKENARKLLSLAAYMLAEGNVMQDYPNWVERHSEAVEYLTSQEISKFFAQISEDERQTFFEHWTKKYSAKEYIAYDVTSISSYSENLSLVEMGYNRDGEKLAQTNLGMYYGEESGLPLFYKIYPGSIVDKAYFPTIIFYSKDMKLKKVRFVMDQGLLSRENFQDIADAGYTALSLLSKNYSLYKEVIDKTIAKQFSAWEFIRSLDIYGRSYEENFFGMKVRVFVYFETEKLAFEEKALYADIERRTQELALIKKQKKLRPSQTKYFQVEESGNREIDFELDYDKIDTIKARLGYFMLISTDLNLDVEEALAIYRKKDIIEKAFDQLKNGMDFKRMRTHHARTTEGKIFVAFIGLIVRSVLAKEIKSSANLDGFTLKQIVRELENICQLVSESETKLITLTKKQKDILAALDVKLN